MLHTDFPTNPNAILEPIIRWYPGAELVEEQGYRIVMALHRWS